ADSAAWASQKMGLSFVMSAGQAHSGLSNGRLVAGDSVGSFQATVPVIDGYACTVEAWLRPSAALERGAMQVMSGQRSATVLVGVRGGGPPDYALTSLSFVPDGAAATILFSVAAPARAPDEFLDVDDVQVTCLPPSTQD